MPCCEDVPAGADKAPGRSQAIRWAQPAAPIARALVEMLQEGMIDEPAARAFLTSRYQKAPARVFGLPLPGPS